MWNSSIPRVDKISRSFSASTFSSTVTELLEKMVNNSVRTCGHTLGHISLMHGASSLSIIILSVNITIGTISPSYIRMYSSSFSQRSWDAGWKSFVSPLYIMKLMHFSALRRCISSFCLLTKTPVGTLLRNSAMIQVLSWQQYIMILLAIFAQFLKQIRDSSIIGKKSLLANISIISRRNTLAMQFPACSNMFTINSVIISITFTRGGSLEFKLVSRGFTTSAICYTILSSFSGCQTRQTTGNRIRSRVMSPTSLGAQPPLNQISQIVGGKGWARLRKRVS